MQLFVLVLIILYQALHNTNLLLTIILCMYAYKSIIIMIGKEGEYPAPPPPPFTGFATVLVMLCCLYCYAQFTGLTKKLPSNIHLLTMQSLGGGRYLLCLDHQYEVDEPPFNEPFDLLLAMSALSLSNRYSSIFISH